MPRTKLNYIDNGTREFTHWVKDSMKDNDMSQADLGRELNIQQQGIAKRLSNGRWKLPEIIQLIHLFKPTEDEIGEVLTKCLR